MERENIKAVIKEKQRALKKLNYCKYRQRDKQALKSEIENLKNLLFSQTITRFRKKEPSFNKLEAKHLGRVKALSLRQPISKRDYMSYKTRWTK